MEGERFDVMMIILLLFGQRKGVEPRPRPVAGRLLNIWGLERDPRRWPLTTTTTRLLLVTHKMCGEKEEKLFLHEKDLFKVFFFTIWRSL
jgi:hypothetical protein